jgi:hypothetical protein
MAAKLTLRVAEPDESKTVKLPKMDKAKEFKGVSLRRLREMLGGEEGTLQDPTDPSVHVPVSLKPWRDADPDTTFFWIEWEFVDPAKVGTKGRGAR